MYSSHLPLRSYLKTVIYILFLSSEGLVKHSRYAEGNVRVHPILKLYDNFSCAVVPYLVESGKSTITSLSLVQLKVERQREMILWL